MVSRRSTQSVTQRSTRQSELHKARRPRRAVTPKTVDDAVGLSRKEERELRRALYASLYESRRPRTPQLEEESSVSEEIPKLRKSTRHVVSPLTYPAGIKERSQASSSNNFDESSQDSVLSSVASSHEAKKKVHAQRKFAQGCSLPSTPGGSPGKKAPTSPHSLLNRVPKTEDFLTFLCLRGSRLLPANLDYFNERTKGKANCNCHFLYAGSRLLPANLDYFNFARDESVDEGSSRPRTPVLGDQGPKEPTRESTPESSSSGSNVNEELVEITTPFATPFRLLQANRKAARASAGTPETARGIVSLRQGLTRKVVHCGATPPSQHSKKYLCTPEKTPSPSGSRLMFGDFTPAKKSASIKCLPASFLRFSPAGKLALERNGNSPRLTPYKPPAVPSPLRTSKVRGTHFQGQGQQQVGFSGVTLVARVAGLLAPIHSSLFLQKLVAPDVSPFPAELVAPDVSPLPAELVAPDCTSVLFLQRRRSTGSVERKKTREEDSPDRSGSKDDKDGMSKDRMMACVVALSDCRPGNTGPLRVKIPETDQGVDATSSSEMFQCAGRKRKYGSAVGEEVGENTSQTNGASCQKGKKRRAESADGVFKVPNAPKFLSAPSEENLPQSDNAPDQTTNADVVTDLAQHAEGVCGEVVKNIAEPAEGGVSMCRQERERLTNRRAALAGQISPSWGQTRDPSSESSDEQENPPCGSPGVRVEVDSGGGFSEQGLVLPGFTEQGSVLPGQTDLSSARGSAQASQKQETSAVDLEEQNSEESDPPAHKNSDEQCAQAGITTRRELMQQGDRLVKYAEELCKTVKRKSNREVSRKAIFSTFKKILRRSFHLTEQAWEKQSSETTFKMEQIFVKLKRNVAELTAQIGHFRKSSTCSGPVLNGLCQACGFFHSVLSLQTGTTDHDLGDNRFGEQSGDRGYAFLQCICDVSLACQLSRLSVVCGEDVNDAPAHSADTDASCLAGTSQDAAVNDDIQVAEPLRGDMSVSVRQSMSISQSSEQTVRKVGDPHRAAVRKVDDPHRAGPSSYNVYHSHPACGQGVAYTCMCGRCRVSRKYLEPKANTQPSSGASLPLGKENHVATATESGEVTDDTPAECDGSFENPPLQKNQLCSKSARDEEALRTLCNSDGSQTLAGDKDEQYERPNLVKSRPALGAVNSWTSAITPPQRPSPRESVAGDSRSILQTKSLNWNSTQGSSLGAAALTPQTLPRSPEHDSHSVASAAQSCGVSVKYQSNKGAVCSHGVDTSAYSDWSGLSGSLGPWLQAGVESRGLNRAPTLYPHPRTFVLVCDVVNTTFVLVCDVVNTTFVLVCDVVNTTFVLVCDVVNTTFVLVCDVVNTTFVLVCDVVNTTFVLVCDVMNTTFVLVCDVVNTTFVLRVPTGTFQPVEPDLARVRREARSSSSSAVRRVLEGASKKLRKTQGPETRQRTHKTDHKPQQDRSRDHRAKNRHKTHTPGSTKNSKGKHAPPRKTPQKTNKVLKVKPRRRSSLRLKTLAKILGRKRPNYSLVLSGYADMEEYEEEQKKKAAKSALARAKAEARARASAKQAAASKPRQPERMTTRSKVKDTDDKDRVGGAVMRSLSNSSAKEAEERRASDRDRSGSFAVRRSLSSSSTSRDAEEKKGEGHRSGGATLKRSLSGGSVGRKEQPALATIIEAKRLKREGGREGAEEGREMGKSGHSNSRERKTVPASPQQAKKVTPKKVTPERPVVASSPEVGLSDLEKVPTFHPTEDEFIDPITYIDSIRDKAEPFGMCRIIPPASWKMESKVNDEIRFTTQIQHLHRLFNRWGPIVEQTRAIVHHLRDIINPQNSSTPQIGGAEVDLPQLYHMIRDLGGLQNIVDKKQWVKVADAMRIPKAAHDRVTRLYDVYCKFVLPFAMLNNTTHTYHTTPPHHTTPHHITPHTVSYAQAHDRVTRLYDVYCKFVLPFAMLNNTTHTYHTTPPHHTTPHHITPHTVCPGPRPCDPSVRRVLQAHDRVTRLYDVYCKFVLPFAMLNQTERDHMQTEAHTHYQLSSAEEDAVLKGKSMTLGTFSRIARNVQSMWFKEQPNAEMVEAAYWRVVGQCRSHVAVQCAHVNTRTQSTAFPLRRESPYFRHSWNLNNLPDNRNCILKCLGPVSGTTIPTLHVGMLFSSSCWSTDPHRLPYVQYLHTGANTVCWVYAWTCVCMH
ncbi:hypothetical protein ACOMHN_002647 [Nucella lapillus]